MPVVRTISGAGNQGVPGRDSDRDDGLPAVCPCDYMITQTYTCMSREEARKAIKRTRRLLMSADDDAVSQRLDLDVALDLLTSGKIAFGRHHFSLIVFSRSLDNLVADTSEISNALNNLGITPVPAALSLSAAYMAQLPGNYHLRPRLGELSSQNFVELAALHNFYPGKRDNAPGEMQWPCCAPRQGMATT